MGGEAADEEQTPILGSFSSSSSSSSVHHDQSHELVKRTGTTRTAVAHIIAGVIGSGVLSLAWSVAQLGWIAGPSSMIVFAIVTLVSTNLLSDCYRYPDPQFGHARCPSYAEAVKLYLGEKWQYVSGAFAYESLYGCGVAYTITSASSVRFRHVSDKAPGHTTEFAELKSLITKEDRRALAEKEEHGERDESPLS